MVKLILYLTFAASFFGIFVAPWLPAVAYWTASLMQPQFVFPYDLQGISITKYLAILSILAWLKAAASGNIDFGIYYQKQNIILLSMWCLMHLSDAYSPYPVYYAAATAEVVLSTMNSIMILYFVTLGLLSPKRISYKPLLIISVMFTLVVVYYVYWSNDHYLSNHWFMFDQGRLTGPPQGPYKDNNNLAIFVVMGMPFIILSFFYIKHKWLKYAAVLITPLLWHSLLMFGSRGALLATIVCTLIIAIMVKSKSFNTILVLGLLAALITQGDTVLDRSKSTVNNANSEDEATVANPRIKSWTVGGKLIVDNPLLGVGTQRFLTASHDRFPGESVHVAHNTFINFSANCGLPVGLLYLSLLWLSYKNYRFCQDNLIEKKPVLDYIGKATIVSLVGFYIGAIFLDLIVFEAFYFLLMVSLVKKHLFERWLSENDTMSQN